MVRMGKRGQGIRLGRGKDGGKGTWANNGERVGEKGKG